MKFNARIVILIIVLFLAVWSINPRPGMDGLTITSVQTGSYAAEAGLQGPGPGTQPVLRERILSLNGLSTDSIDEYYEALDSIIPGVLVQIRTNENSYVVSVPEPFSANATNQTNETNETTEVILNRLDTGEIDLGIRVQEPPTNNVRKGLDLTGGARVLLQPTEPVDEPTMELLIENIQERLNVFGLSDVIVRSTRDFAGAQYILVEIAGANEDEITELITSQGKFEALIGDELIFEGGDDVRYVGRSATDSGLQRCLPDAQGFYCQFYFSISISPQAAARQAAATAQLEVVPSGNQLYLSETLDLFLDGENISNLNIASSLQGSETTTFQISGGEFGATEASAAEAALQEMRRLQTVVATGSLPVELEVVKTDAISAALGEEFIKNIWLVGLFAILAVIVVVAGRYRDIRIAIPMVITMLSEVIIVLGIAALIGWNLDLAAIAGILIAIGTGVDDQIIIVDEIKTGSKAGTWKQRMKKAFFIIFAAFFTLLAAMLPLMWAGAGLVRGFAITTILGVTVGVLVTRPAFAAIAEKLIKSN